MYFRLYQIFFFFFSAIVIKTNIIEHNYYDEILPAAIEENTPTEYDSNVSIPSQFSKSKGHVFMTAVYMDNVNHWSLGRYFFRINYYYLSSLISELTLYLVL